jgi:D-alanyl-D-alanine carboxypeptidase/D-alanyl-D-alanine-endopeptidase (penicillin-binding protein 4)
MLRVYGSIAVDAQPDVEEVAIQDPAEYAALALKGMLEARGIVVTGAARAKHQISRDTKGFVTETHEEIQGFNPLKHYNTQRMHGVRDCSDHCDPNTLPTEKVLALHESPPLSEDVVVTNKVSQNLHAELFLHQLGAAVVDDGSTAQGARVVRQFLQSAGIDKDDFLFFDGSGLSGHDLVAPRATARLLQYASAQPWFADWKKSLPVGGEDDSLAERFAKAPLKDHVFAKTGTLGEARALSGYLDCASGKTVIFSIMVGNHLPQTHADRDLMDRIVEAIAAAN